MPVHASHCLALFIRTIPSYFVSIVIAGKVLIGVQSADRVQKLLAVKTLKKNLK